MAQFMARFKKFLNKGGVRSLFLMLAVVAAVVAQISLPPSDTTLTLNNPLPVPVWKSALLMEGPLIPFRTSFALFFSAMLMLTIAFWGKSLEELPWKKLKFAKKQASEQEAEKDKEKFYKIKLNLGEDQSMVEISLVGAAQYWRRNLITIGLLVFSFILSLVTYFLFQEFTQTNLGLGIWMVSLLVLLASASIYSFFQSNSGPFRLADYLWAGFALLYALLSVWLLSLGNPWGILTWLFSIASIFGWKLKRNKRQQPSSTLSSTPVALTAVSNNQELDSAQPESQFDLHKKAFVESNPRKRIFQTLFKILSDRMELIVFIILIGLGGYFRFGNIFDIAPGLNNDVAMLLGAATQIVQGKVAYTPFSSIGWGFESLFLYDMAFWMQIFGPNYLAARFASASVGFITLIVVYIMARLVAGKRVAWISTALLAASGIHIVFSDLGSRLIFQPLFEALSLLLFWSSLEKRKYWLFILTGISLGFTIQAYNASVFDPLLFVLFFIYLLIQNWKKRKRFLQKFLPGVLIIGIAFFITAAPLAGFVSSNWDTYRARSNSLLVTHRMQESENAFPGTYWSPIVRNLVVGSLIFNQRGNSNDLYIGESGLDFPITILFVLALAFTLRFWKKPLPFFILAWFFMGLSAGYVSEPNANRSFGSLIPIYLMCGLFLAAFINFMKEWYKKDGGFLIGSVITVIIIIVTIGFTYKDYVGPDYKYRWGYAERATGIGVYVNQLRNQNTPIYITDAYFVTDTVRMMSYRSGEEYEQRPYIRLSMYDVLAKGFPDRSDVMVVLGHWPEEEMTRDILLKLYPHSKLEIIPKIDTHWENEKSVGFGILIPQSNIQSPAPLQNGLLSQYYKGWDGQGEPFQRFVDPFIILPVLPDAELGHFSTIWTGTFVIDTIGKYDFQLRSNNRAQLFIDDTPVLAIATFNKADPERDQFNEGGIELSQGSHRIKIVYNYEGANIRLGVLWKIPGADFNWLPVRNFSPQ